MTATKKTVVTYQLQVCSDPQNNPRSYENIGPTCQSSQDLIQVYEDLSLAFRCGKAFQVISAGGIEIDLQEFLWEKC